MKKIGLILGLLNTVVVLGVLGLFVYTKLIFKRPAITESKERAKLVAKKTVVLEDATPATLLLESLTANFDPFTDEMGKQKIHYVSLTIAFEIRDENQTTRFDEAKPVLMDKILHILSKKKFEDLNQVQGRYVFRSQIIDAANEYFGSTFVTEVYFNDFLLQ
jgi:flagellar basal body-associated protein FliL